MGFSETLKKWDPGYPYCSDTTPGSLPYREFVESRLIGGINFGGAKTMTHQGFGYSDHPLIFVGCSCDPGQRNPKELVLKN